MIETLRKELLLAAKAKDIKRVQALRLLVASLETENKKKEVQMSDEELLSVLRTEAKKRKEAIEIYKSNGREEQSAAEQFELSVIEEFLPKLMSEDEIREVVKSVLSSFENSNMGMVVGEVMKRIGKGKADGSLVSKVVKEECSN